MKSGLSANPLFYQSYLLRCWQEEPASAGSQAGWRFSLQEITGEQRLRGFSNLEELLAFLEDELAVISSQDFPIPP